MDREPTLSKQAIEQIWGLLRLRVWLMLLLRIEVDIAVLAYWRLLWE